jgi:hypothetical protein
LLHIVIMTDSKPACSIAYLPLISSTNQPGCTAPL